MAEVQSRYHCHKCRWFYAVDDSDPSEENWTGECRRYAPSPHKYQAVGTWTTGTGSGGKLEPDSSTTTFVLSEIDNTAEHWKWPYCVGGWFCGDFSPYDGAFTE